MTSENILSQKFNTKTLMIFAVPSIIMMVFVSIYSMVGSVFAANYVSENAMSAINIVFPFISLVLAVAIMFATGANAIIAKNLGEHDEKKARENFTVMSILGTLAALFFTAIWFLFSNNILSFLGSTPALHQYATIYGNIYAITFPLLFWQIFAQFFFVTIGKPGFGMAIVVVGGFLCIVVNYIITAILNFGIAGSAIGIAVANGIPGIIFIIYFLVKKSCVLHFVKPKMHKGFILNTCTNGSSEMVTNLAVAVITAVMNVIMVRLAGEDGIAAVSVIVQVQFLLSSMYIGYGAGVAPIFAYAQGEDNREQTKKVFNISIKFIIISSIILVALCLLMRNQIVGMFINPTSTAFELAQGGFTIFSFGYLFAGFNIFSSVFFTSVSNGKISAFISFLRTFAFILGMLLILPVFFGTTGVWFATPMAECLTVFVGLLMFIKYKNVYNY